ncbi:hypothetical protein RvY_01962 [Ramazzottius varieornatus]|uniref:Fringe-like glycosyltransferase domain-containing protein n=1 Tax=Ramazzottius varieornatus TaxID=947166 RepID=A0A1D1UIZ1_RAMVA|nr:hypothetical protein RvY_01962 [Ramazzottius varieornatus]
MSEIVSDGQDAMRKWVFSLLISALFCFVTYRLPPQTASSPTNHSAAGSPNRSFHKTIYTPACVPLSPETPSDFLFLTVRTTPVKHHSRLKASQDTWIKDAADMKSSDGKKTTKIYVVTDSYTRKSTQENLDGSHIIYETHCGRSIIQSQGCSLHKELSLFYTVADHARWFCHVDDDAYINVPALLVLLSQHNHEEPFYIGRRSLPTGIWGWDHLNKKHIMVDFVTGQVICLSKTAMEMLKPLVTELKHPWNFLRLTRHHPDDIILGYIFQHYLHMSITESQRMYIQYDDLRNLTETDIRNAATMSYGRRNVFVLPRENATVVAEDSISKRFHALHSYYTQKSRDCQKPE